jgi:hypothetical protein
MPSETIDSHVDSNVLKVDSNGSRSHRVDTPVDSNDTPAVRVCSEVDVVDME